MQIETKPSAPVENSAAPAPAARLFDEGQLGLVMDVELNVILRFGQRQLSLREIMELTSGSVVDSTARWMSRSNCCSMAK